MRNTDPWRHRAGLERRLLLGQMRWTWETVAWQTEHRWKQTFSTHFSSVLSESVPWIRKRPLSAVLHALPVTKACIASVYFLPCFYGLLFIFITVINLGIFSCKERQEFLMIVYVSKGGFRVEVMLFNLYKRPYIIKLVMRLFTLCITCVLICARPLPGTPTH